MGVVLAISALSRDAVQRESAIEQQAMIFADPSKTKAERSQAWTNLKALIESRPAQVIEQLEQQKGLK